MRQDKSGYQARTFRLPPELCEALDAYAERHDMIKGAVVARALEEYFRKDGADLAGKRWTYSGR